MVWKQDLAKLKQQLKEEGGPTPPPPPKPPPPALPTRSIGEEDATFLTAMGKPAPAKVAPAGKSPAPPVDAPQTFSGQTETEAEFKEAIGGLPGMRPLGRNPVLSAPVPIRAEVAVPEQAPAAAEPLPVAIPPEPVPEEAVPEVVTVPRPTPSKEPPGPRLIHLAAGMAVEVEAVLDLRGHSVHDAKERLKERLQDASVLGWRTLQVILGPSEALRQAFLAFLMSPPAKILAQYAQAPIPMGGNQAFIVYILGPTA